MQGVESGGIGVESKGLGVVFCLAVQGVESAGTEG